MNLDGFFAYARERHAIYLRRSAGLSAPWTADPVLQQYRFCNVFRELDTTTIWFREHVRDRLRSAPEVLLATVLFRWFNRITTGEAIFSQVGMLAPGDHHTAWDCLGWLGPDDGLDKWVGEYLRPAIVAYCGRGPYVTGSYIVQGRAGMPKLDGVLSYFEEFATREHDYPGDVATAGLGWREVADLLLANRTWEDTEARFGSLEQTWNWLRKFQGLGPFMAYEIVSDLRYTSLLDWAPDILTWANPGPGAFRGMSRIVTNDEDRGHFQSRNRAEVIGLMRKILSASRSSEFWPQLSGISKMKLKGVPDTLDTWSAWDMRTVEHTLCEYDKYRRVQRGEGRPRQVFRHG